ncbi:MAG: RNA polymerase sigma factor, partial [Massilia sp.]
MSPAPAPTDDHDLLRQIQGGAAIAFEALYRRHQGPLYRFCLMRSGSAEIAADVVQEVFMGLLTGAYRFDLL